MRAVDSSNALAVDGRTELDVIGVLRISQEPSLAHAAKEQLTGCSRHKFPSFSRALTPLRTAPRHRLCCHRVEDAQPSHG